MKIVTRQEALSQGLKFYFTGKPCKQGHVNLRYTSGASCKACTDARALKSYRDNIEEGKKKRRNWHKRNAEHSKAYRKNG